MGPSEQPHTVPNLSSPIAACRSSTIAWWWGSKLAGFANGCWPCCTHGGPAQGGRLGCKAPLGPAPWAGGNTRAGPTAPRGPGGKWHTPPVPPARAAGGWVATRPRQHARRVGGGGAAVIDSKGSVR